MQTHITIDFLHELDNKLTAVAPISAACKCCGSRANLFGVVDFNRSCLDNGSNPGTLSGIPIYYYRCPACGFLFTGALDAFSHDDFKRLIYNQSYAQVDPDYADARPRANAEVIAKLFSQSRDIRILDYGGGRGLLARLLSESGFSRVDTYDPLVAENSIRPDGRYDLVLSFEVIEHSIDPKGTFSDLNQYLNESGMALFTTAFQPPDILKLNTSWWYIAPRNGHLSLHTPRSVMSVIEGFGLRLASAPQGNIHLLFRGKPPAFAAHLKIA